MYRTVQLWIWRAAEKRLDRYRGDGLEVIFVAAIEV